MPAPVSSAAYAVANPPSLHKEIASAQINAIKRLFMNSPSLRTPNPRRRGLHSTANRTVSSIWPSRARKSPLQFSDAEYRSISTFNYYMRKVRFYQAIFPFSWRNIRFITIFLQIRLGMSCLKYPNVRHIRSCTARESRAALHGVCTCKTRPHTYADAQFYFVFQALRWLSSRFLVRM